MTDEAMADAAALTRARQSLMAPRGPIDAEVPQPDDPTLDAPVETNRGAGIRLAEIGEEGWRWLTARVGRRTASAPSHGPRRNAATFCSTAQTCSIRTPSASSSPDETGAPASPRYPSFRRPRGPRNERWCFAPSSPEAVGRSSPRPA